MRVHSIGWWMLPAVSLFGAGLLLGQTAPPLPLPPDAAAASGSSSLIGAVQQVAQARAELRAANEQVERFEKQARAELAKDPDFAAASKALDEARSRKNSARAEALAQAKDSAPYVQAQSKLTNANAVTSQTSASIADVDKATSDAIDARMEMSRIEAAALKDSPEVKAADAQYQSANSEYESKWQQYKAKELPNNRSWQAAISQQEQAQATVKSAEEQLTAARQQAAAARRAQGSSVGAASGSRRSSSYGGSRSSRSSRSSGSRSRGMGGY